MATFSDFFSSAWRIFRGIATRKIEGSGRVRIEILSGHSQTLRHRRVRVAQSWAFSWKSIAGDTISRGICGILSKGPRTVPKKPSLKLFCGICAPVSWLTVGWKDLNPCSRVEQKCCSWPYIRFFRFLIFKIYFRDDFAKFLLYSTDLPNISDG